MTHHHLCPVTQVPGKPKPCCCVQIETVERGGYGPWGGCPR